MRFTLNRNADGGVYMTRQPSLEPRANLAHICCDPHRFEPADTAFNYITAQHFVEVLPVDQMRGGARFDVRTVRFNEDGGTTSEHVTMLRVSMVMADLISSLLLRQEVERILEKRTEAA